MTSIFMAFFLTSFCTGVAVGSKIHIISHACMHVCVCVCAYAHGHTHTHKSHFISEDRLPSLIG